MSGQRILFGTDYSEASEHALQYATWLAKSTGGKLYIVHVSDREQYPVGELFEEEPAPDPEQLRRLNFVRPADPSVPYEHRLLYGEPGSVETTDPAKVIVDFARKEDIDLIVLGTHGRTGFSRALMGSVAESVVRHAHCPVVTIRQAQAAAVAG